MKKKRILECYLCRRVLRGQKMSNLRRHIRLHGPFVKCSKCLECGKTFQNATNLRQHWKRFHEIDGIEPKMMSVSRKAKPFHIVEVRSNNRNKKILSENRSLGQLKVEVKPPGFVSQLSRQSVKDIQVVNVGMPPICYKKKTKYCLTKVLPKIQITHDLQFEKFTNFGKLEWEMPPEFDIKKYCLSKVVPKKQTTYNLQFDKLPNFGEIEWE